MPISYSGRTYQEGKKIGWRDGVKALSAIVRFWWSDRIYHDDEHGSQILARMARAPRFNAWMADTIRPCAAARVLEIGSGTGNLTRQLMPRDQYVASDINPLYLASLRALTADRPYLDVTATDVTRGESFPRLPGGFDTVVCLNVVEHVDDDVGALRNIRDVLAPDGRVVAAGAAGAGGLRHPRRGAGPPAALHHGLAPGAGDGGRLPGARAARAQPARPRRPGGSTARLLQAAPLRPLPDHDAQPAPAALPRSSTGRSPSTALSLIAVLEPAPAATTGGPAAAAPATGGAPAP